MKNRSHRYDIDKPRPRHGHNYTIYKMYFNIMVTICIKQYLRNIWSSIYEKVKQHWGWVEKKCCLQKECVHKKLIFSIYKMLTLNMSIFYLQVKKSTFL